MRYKRPDSKNALSIIESAKKTMDYTLTLEINEQSAIENFAKIAIFAKFSSSGNTDNKELIT